MSKTRQIAKNVGRIVKYDALTKVDNNLLASNNAEYTNDKMVADFISAGGTATIASNTYEFNNKFIGKTISMTARNGFHYILLTPVDSGVFVIDGDFIIKDNTNKIRTFSTCANIGVSSIARANLENASSNDTVMFVTYQSKTWVAIQIETTVDAEVYFSGFISVSIETTDITITTSDFIGSKSVIYKNNISNSKWDTVEMNMLHVAPGMTNMTTLKDGNVFFLEMDSPAANSTAGNNSNGASGLGGGTLKTWNNAWIINPYTGEMRKTARFPWFPINNSKCVTLADGDVLVFFGYSVIAGATIPNQNLTPAILNELRPYPKYVYRYSPKTELWSIETKSPTVSGWDKYGLAIHPDGKNIVIMGGVLGYNSALNTSIDVNTYRPYYRYPFIYNTETKKWTKAGKDTANYFIPRSDTVFSNFDMRVVHLVDNLFFVHAFDSCAFNGGDLYNNPKNYIWDMNSYLFTPVTGNPLQCTVPVLEKLSDNRVAIIGGYKPGVNFNSYLNRDNYANTNLAMTIYDHTTKTFSALSSAPISLAICPSTKLNDGRLMIGQPSIVPSYNSTTKVTTQNITGQSFFFYDDNKYHYNTLGVWEIDAIIPSSIMNVYDSSADLKDNTSAATANYIDYISECMGRDANGNLLFGGFYGFDYTNNCMYSSKRWYSYKKSTGINRLSDNQLFPGGQVPLVPCSPNEMIMLGGYGRPSNYPTSWSDTMSSRFYKLNLSTNTWSLSNVSVENLGIAFADGSAVRINDGRIFYGLCNNEAKGIGYSSTSERLYCYNPATDSVTRMADCPYKIRTTAFVYDNVNERIYVFNTLNDQPNRKIYYNILTNTWTDTGKLYPDARYTAGCLSATNPNEMFILNYERAIKYNLVDDSYTVIPHPSQFVMDLIKNTAALYGFVNYSTGSAFSVIYKYVSLNDGLAKNIIMTYKP
ncbi:g296 [Yersinia phage phiR1-37]|uniref:hypothetical protein n=1 Tax=Yersinia phage phiR1-37 TaxID=331278 RepID=UPI00022DBDD3|nr:hypothetical protein phiR1-37_gp296 [Yersinia phage phiR1-37]CCE26319.1 g296 [Yersinia phage phiR1-37]